MGGCARRVDTDDLRVRNRRAKELTVQHARQHDVVGKLRLSGDLGAPIDAPPRRADDLHEVASAGSTGPGLRTVGATPRGAGSFGPAESAIAASTASKICWYPVHRPRQPDSPS